MERVAIVGVGLIGGSIGLGLKAARLTELEVIGHDRDRDTAQQAKKMSAVHRMEPDLRAAVRDAALVIVATPVRTIRRVFEDIAPHLGEGAVVTDTGSTKGDVLRWAAELLPPNVSFVGGHPMAGKETQSVGAADANLFRERIYCVIPAVTAKESAVRLVLGLVQTLGATPWFIDAEEHDQYVAAISHVPLIASAALFTMARDSRAWDDLAPLAGPGFRDLTRLASGDPQMATDIFATNRDAVLHWLDRFQSQISAFRQLIERQEETAADDALFARLVEAQLRRDEFMVGRFDRGAPRPPVELPSASETLTSFFISARIAERFKDAQRVMDNTAKDRADRLARDVERDLDRDKGRRDRS